MMSYKDKLKCGEYVPPCILSELERLDREVTRLHREILTLKREKVDRTPIVPERDNNVSKNDD